MPENVQTLSLTNDRLIDILYRMTVIRYFEEKVERLTNQGKIYGALHLCIGQEAATVGACEVLEERDKILSTHRGHGHSIAKGTNINAMMAELFGRATGVCKGKGGSMHIADLDKGNLGANGIVAAGLPLATGSALASKMKNLGYVVLCFFGDGATNEGAFHESLNLAAIWDLPVIFFCENNQYGMSGPMKDMMKVEHIADRAASYGMPGVTIDGNDVLEVMKVTAEAVERARSGQGPTLIEATTYRFKGHNRNDAKRYRLREEEEEWRNTRDPIVLFRNRLINDGVLTEERWEQLVEKVNDEIEEAVRFAEQSPMPTLDALEEDVYA